MSQRKERKLLIAKEIRPPKLKENIFLNNKLLGRVSSVRPIKQAWVVTIEPVLQ